MLLEQILESYSKSFILATMVLVKQYQEYYPKITDLLEGNVESIDKKLNDCYEQLKVNKERKKKEEAGLNVGSTKKIGSICINKKVVHS